MKADIQRLIQAEHDAKKREASLVLTPVESNASTESTGNITSRELPVESQTARALPAMPFMNAMAIPGTAERRVYPGAENKSEGHRALPRSPTPEETVLTYLSKLSDAAAKLTVDIEKAMAIWKDSSEYQSGSLTDAFRSTTHAMRLLSDFEDRSVTAKNLTQPYAERCRRPVLNSWQSIMEDDRRFEQSLERRRRTDMSQLDPQSSPAIVSRHSISRSYDYSREEWRWSSSRSRSPSRSATRRAFGIKGAAAEIGVVISAANSQKTAESAAGQDAPPPGQDRSRRRIASADSISSDVTKTETPSYVRYRNRRITEAELASTTPAGIWDRAHSQSRDMDRERSRSKVSEPLPVAAAGLRGAALAGLYEKDIAGKKNRRDNLAEEGLGRAKRHQERGDDTSPLGSAIASPDQIAASGEMIKPETSQPAPPNDGSKATKKTGTSRSVVYKGLDWDDQPPRAYTTVERYQVPTADPWSPGKESAPEVSSVTMAQQSLNPLPSPDNNNHGSRRFSASNAEGLAVPTRDVRFMFERDRSHPPLLMQLDQVYDHELERYTKDTDYYQQPQEQPQRIIIRERDERAPAPIIIRQIRNSQNEDINWTERESAEHLAKKRTPLPSAPAPVAPPPQEEDYFYERRVVERERPRSRDHRLEIRPKDTASNYSSDDSYKYVRRGRSYLDGDETDLHQKRNLACGALAGAAAGEILRHHRKSEGTNASYRLPSAVGGTLVGSIGTETLSRARSRRRSRRGSISRSRSSSYDDRRSRRHRGRARSRSLSLSCPKYDVDEGSKVEGTSEIRGNAGEAPPEVDELLRKWTTMDL